jgi:hypothetical protein
VDARQQYVYLDEKWDEAPLLAGGRLAARFATAAIGRFEQRAAEPAHRAEARYGQARSYALLDQRAPLLRALREAIELSPDNGPRARSEPSFVRFGYERAFTELWTEDRPTLMPIAREPAAKEPAATKPAAEKPAAEKPAAKKPAAKKPATKKPTAKKPATKKRPAKTRPAKTRLAKKRPAKKPAAKKRPTKEKRPTARKQSAKKRPAKKRSTAKRPTAKKRPAKKRAARKMPKRSSRAKRS